MQAIIMAAGKGSRLGDLTKGKPKSFTEIKGKKLIRVLDKFTPDLPGYHLYYPHRRHAGSAFSLFIDRLKYKGAV